MALRNALTNEAATGLVDSKKEIFERIDAVRAGFFNRPEVSAALGNNGLRPIDMLLANRDQVIAQSPLISQVLSEVRSRPRTKKAEQKFPSRVNQEFTSTTDARTRDIREAFANLEQRDRLLSAIDETVTRSSERNIEAIDRGEGRGEVVKKDLVIVGGGPLTSLTVSILAPYFNITVVTQDRSVGFPWRSRPIFINSSSEDDGVSARLPLLKGSTTPIVPKDMLNLLGSDAIADLDPDTLPVTCADGTKRRYVSGIALGEGVAINIGTQVSDYIVGQKVLPDRITVNPDGSKRLVLQDPTPLRDPEAKPKERTIDANAVLFLTGPGEENCPLLDTNTQLGYQVSKRQLDGRIRDARAAVRPLRKELDRTTDPRKRKELKDRIRTEAAFELPTVLTLTAVEKMLEFWIVDLKRDPDLYPLAPIFQEGNKIADIGNGDTGRTLSEFFRFLGPERSYPRDFRQRLDAPLVTIYNEKAATPEEYDAENRVRYSSGRVVGKNVATIPDKVTKVLRGTRNRGNTPESYIQVSDTSGGQAREYNFGLISLGFARTAIEALLNRAPRGGIRTGEIQSDGGNAAIGSATNDIYVGGSATGFMLQDFPLEIQVIINGLKIRENTVALWVFGLLQEKLAWTLAADPNRLKNVKAGNTRIAEVAAAAFRRGRR